MSKEQFAKIIVIIERTYLIPIKDGKSIGGDTPEEIKDSWFGDPNALNSVAFSRDTYRLGGSDIIKSAEITEIIDVKDGSI